MRDDDVLAVAAVGDDAAEGSEEEYGNLAGETYPAQQQSRTGQAVDEPGLGHGLHPGAGEGNQLSAEKELEVAMAEGASRGLPAWQRTLGGGDAVAGRVLLNGSFGISHDFDWMTMECLEINISRAVGSDQ